MRVVFLGTPEFAVPALQMLLENHYEVCCVITQPDRPSGRGQKSKPSPVKLFAQCHGIPIFQPEKIRAEENRRFLTGLRPDFLVTVAYGQILPGWLLETARIAPVNVHASLLPRYRGAAPISWAIMNGDEITGVTTMWMEESLDAGPILLQQELPIHPEKTAGELAEDLAHIGADLLVRTLEGLGEGTIVPIQQDEKQATWAPPITKEIAKICWSRPAMAIHNLIRAMNPWPGAYTVFRGERLQIWRSSLVKDEVAYNDDPGTLVDISREGIMVQCGDQTVLEVVEVQQPGRRKISGREFANGMRLQPGNLIFSGCLDT